MELRSLLCQRSPQCAAENSIHYKHVKFPHLFVAAGGESEAALSKRVSCDSPEEVPSL